MKYALNPLVSLWMSLYYSLPRIRKWARENNITPTVNESFNFLARQSFRKEDYERFRRVRLDYILFKRHRFQAVLSALEFPFQRALRIADVDFQAGKKVYSLLDFPRFQGASWSHNDIIVYMPNEGVAAVMKLSDKKFGPLCERLSTITKGVDPFVGTTFTISRAKLNPVFNRIRCSSETSVDVLSFQRLDSFSDLINVCRRGYKSPSYMASVIMGNAPLDLSRCVIARYENYYCLMEFFQSQARIKSAVRERDWTYNFVFDFQGVPCKAWMFRDSLFDSLAIPEKIPKDSKVDVLGFITYGRTSLQAFGTRVHLLALNSASRESSSEKCEEIIESNLPTVNAVEDELIRLSLKKERKLYFGRKWPKVPETPSKFRLIRINDPLFLGDLARSLSALNVSVQDLFDWDNGGQQLLLRWSRAGRRSSNTIEELRSALKFILVMRTEIKIPEHFLREKGGTSH
jgi:hypothetical protein